MFLSSGTFFNWLSKYDVNLGTTLAILIVVSGFCISLYKMIQGYNKMVGEKTKEDLNVQNTLDSVKSLVASVNTLKDEIIEDRKHSDDYRKDVNKKLDEIQILVENEKALSRKVDIELKHQIADLTDKVDVIDKKSNLLIESDKEGIKGNITEKYYNALDVGYIEIHTLETLEAQYEKYLEENGNTFVSGLMESLRKMPNTKPVNKKPTPRKRPSNSNSDS